MFLSISSSLYESLIGANPLEPAYREGIFPTVGLITPLVALVVALLFYAGLGRWRPVFHRTIHWVATLVLIALFGFFFAYMQTKGETGIVDSYTVRFGLINALYAVIYFFIFTLILRRVSIFAKHTPF